MTPSMITGLAGGLGALAVALGAFGAHGLRDQLTPERLETWQTAAHYQLVHAVALVSLAAALPSLESAWAARAAWLWLAGVVVFSGSLYALCLTGVRALGAITPLGGLCLILGWCALVMSAIRAGGTG